MSSNPKNIGGYSFNWLVLSLQITVLNYMYHELVRKFVIQIVLYDHYTYVEIFRNNYIQI